MSMQRCQLADFTFYLFMAGHPLLSTGDIARETGLTPQRIWQLAVAGRIPAKQASHSGKWHRFYDSAEFAAWRKEQRRRSARPVGKTTTHAQRISRKRRERIECLLKILDEKKAVTPNEKKLALHYLHANFLLSMGHDLPLVEGIHAFVGSKGFGRFDVDLVVFLALVQKGILQLPTRSAPRRRRSPRAPARSKTTPQLSRA